MQMKLTTQYNRNRSRRYMSKIVQRLW